MKVFIIILTIVFVLGIFLFFSQKAEVLIDDISEKKENTSNYTFENNSAQNKAVIWQFDFNTKQWLASGKPPSCLDPFVIYSPIDVRLADGILYPGQIRGTDYKPHGGFRFDNLENNEVDVYASFDASLVKAARHLESGEIQYSLYFINDCGFMYKLDHLRELTDKFEEILDKVPMGAEGDSRTTEINPPVFISKGEHIATKVGIESNKNVFMDFGLYDLREKNGV